MRNILVTAISGNIGYGILKVLKSENQRLYGCDVNEIAAGMDLVEEFWQCRYAAEESYVDELLEQCVRRGITHLIPVNEREIEAVGAERKRFEEKHIQVLIQSRKILEICLDKYKTAIFLSQHGICVPKTYKDAAEIADKDGRYICKPRKSNGSKDILVFTPGKQECLAGKKNGDYVFQEYIDSRKEYTAGVFRYRNTTNVIAFLRQLKDGYSNQVEFTEDVEIRQIAEKAADIFELEGYFNLQMRKKDGIYYVFEINPRISGTVRFRHLLGFTDVLWWLDAADGKEAEPYQSKYKKAVGVRELNEKYLILE